MSTPTDFTPEAATAAAVRNAAPDGRIAIETDDIVKGFIPATPGRLRPALERPGAGAGVDVSSRAVYLTL